MRYAVQQGETQGYKTMLEAQDKRGLIERSFIFAYIKAQEGIYSDDFEWHPIVPLK